MIPIPVPQGPAQFVQASPETVRRIRSRSILVGLPLILLSPVILIAGIAWAFSLPTAVDVLNLFVVGMTGLSSLFLLLIGIAAFSSRSSVKTGALNVTHASGTRRGMLVFWIGSIFTTGLTWASMALIVASSANHSGRPPITFTPEILSFMAFVALPVILGLFGWRTTRSTLRP